MHSSRTTHWLNSHCCAISHIVWVKKRNIPKTWGPSRGIVSLHPLTETEHVLADLIEVVSLSFLRGMEDNYCGADDGEETADLPVEVESLLQQVGRQHRTEGGGGGGGGGGGVVERERGSGCVLLEQAHLVRTTHFYINGTVSAIRSSGAPGAMNFMFVFLQ